jgi:bifunctional DNA-binding transcriptional regulator/antitoxin component of YhaV-PrlF toxin-antitoxin module
LGQFVGGGLKYNRTPIFLSKSSYNEITIPIFGITEFYQWHYGDQGDMTTNSIQIRKKGGITLPMDFRMKYGVSEGDVFTLVDLGDGSFLLTPHLSRINQIGERITKILDEENMTIDDLLKSLDDERETY